MYLYAQINNDGICYSINSLSEKVNHEKLIPLKEEVYTTDLLGKKYFEGEFIEVEEISEEDKKSK